MADGISISFNDLLSYISKGLATFADPSLRTTLDNAENVGRSTISDQQLMLYIAKATASMGGSIICDGGTP